MNKIRKEQLKTVTIIKALLASYVVSGIILLLLAFVMYKLEPPSMFVDVGIIFAYIFSAFVGGMIMGKCAQEKRYLWGILMGVLFFLVIFLLSFVMNKAVFGQVGSTVTVFLMCSLGGMLGGMVS